MLITRRSFTKAAAAVTFAVITGSGFVKRSRAALPGKGPSLGPFFDFAAGVLPEGVRYARRGEATCWDHRGLLQRTDGNAPRFEYEPNTGQVLGLLHESAALNRVTNCRNLTTPKWEATNMEAARAPTFWDALGGEGTILYAGKDNATILARKPLGVAEYTFSAWVRRKAGWGRVDVTLDGGSTWTEVSALLLDGVWTRVVETRTLSAPSVGFRLGRKGDEIEVDLCQLEEGAFATSELPSHEESWRRSADRLRLSLGDALEWQFRWPPAAEIAEERHIRSIALDQISESVYDITITTPDGEYTILSETIGSALA